MTLVTKNKGFSESWHQVDAVAASYPFTAVFSPGKVDLIDVARTWRKILDTCTSQAATDV